MNPWDLDASGLMIWGLVLHLIADWPLQNDYMANHKAGRRWRGDAKGYGPWFDRHPAALVHAGIHGVLLALAFGWVAVPLALVHLAIDTRVPVVWWSKLVGQTQPAGKQTVAISAGVRSSDVDIDAHGPGYIATVTTSSTYPVLDHSIPAYDIGTEVRFWTDQVFHVATIAVAALIVGAIA